MGIIPVHAHYAIQIAFGSEPGIRFRSSERDDWTEYRGAIIPSRQPHSMDATVVPFNVVIFIEPETREGRALSEIYLRDGIARLPDDKLAAVVPQLFAAWQQHRTEQAVTAAAHRVVHALTGGVEPAVVSDERILRAISYIKRHLDASLTLERSPGRRTCLRAASGTSSWRRLEWRSVRTFCGAASSACVSCSRVASRSRRPHIVPDSRTLRT